jgi:hypothetical protein
VIAKFDALGKLTQASWNMTVATEINNKPAMTVHELFESAIKMHDAGLDWSMIVRTISLPSQRGPGVNPSSRNPWPSSLQPRGVEIIYTTGEKICFTGRDWVYTPAKLFLV